jgi:threonyl-tRNA synthetase
MLKDKGIRAELDASDENLGTKIRAAKTMKIPYTIIIGDKEIEANKITLESRDMGNLGQKSNEELLKHLLDEIQNKA